MARKHPDFVGIEPCHTPPDESCKGCLKVAIALTERAAELDEIFGNFRSSYNHACAALSLRWELEGACPLCGQPGKLNTYCDCCDEPALE